MSILMAASHLLSLAIGLGVLSAGVNFLLSGSLKNDNSAIGITVKVVIVAVGLAFVVILMKAMLGSKSQQRQWRSQLHKGVTRSGQTLMDDFGSAKKLVKSLSREGGKIGSNIKKRFSI